MAKNDTGNVNAVVTVGLYAWHEKCGDPTTPLNEARRGDEIAVSAEEFKRGSTMTPVGLVKKDSKEHRAFLAGPTTDAAKLASLSDDELRAVATMRGADGADEMNRDELLAVVLASPGQS